MVRKNVNPSTWGPAAWDFLKHSAEACDAESAEDYEAFVHLLPSVLPCERCREHAAAYIADNPVDTDDLVAWLTRFRLAIADNKRVELEQGGACNVYAKDDYDDGYYLFLWIVVLVCVVLCVWLLAQRSKA